MARVIPAAMASRSPYTLPFGETVSDDYHVYAIEWSQNSIVWYVDGAAYHTVTPASLPAGTKWVFNAPFFILLNLAIGGPTTFLGTPDAAAPFPRRTCWWTTSASINPSPSPPPRPSSRPGAS